MTRRAQLLNIMAEVDTGNRENAERILDALEAAGALRTPGTSERCTHCHDTAPDGVFTLAGRDRAERPCPAIRCPVRLGRDGDAGH